MCWLGAINALFVALLALFAYTATEISTSRAEQAALATKYEILAAEHAAQTKQIGDLRETMHQELQVCKKEEHHLKQLQKRWLATEKMQEAVSFKVHSEVKDTCTELIATIRAEFTALIDESKSGIVRRMQEGNDEDCKVVEALNLAHFSFQAMFQGLEEFGGELFKYKRNETDGRFLVKLRDIERSGVISTGLGECMRAVCADTYVEGQGLICQPWGEAEAVDCIDKEQTIQAFPSFRSNPPCCRKEWLAEKSGRECQNCTGAPFLFFRLLASLFPFPDSLFSRLLVFYPLSCPHSVSCFSRLPSGCFPSLFPLSLLLVAFPLSFVFRCLLSIFVCSQDLLGDERICV